MAHFHALDFADGASLSALEQTRLAELEHVVERGLDAFTQVAAALIEIRDGRLYRATHGTFEDYVRERFSLASRTAYGYIEAAGVIRNLPAQAHLSVSHLRALAPLDPDDQRALAPVVSEMTLAEARRVIKSWRAGRRARMPSERQIPPLPAGTYRAVVVDPPWRFQHDWGDGLAADQYPTLADEEIKALPVGDLAAPDSHLYLWAPVAKVPAALEICEKWGFSYTSLLTWVKPGLGLGTWWRHGTEHIVFGVRGSLRTTPNLSNWFEAPRRRHSAKPDEFYELVERASPGPYVDLFARRGRPRWTTWGDELAGREAAGAEV